MNRHLQTALAAATRVREVLDTPRGRAGAALLVASARVAVAVRRRQDDMDLRCYVLRLERELDALRDTVVATSANPWATSRRLHEFPGGDRFRVTVQDLTKSRPAPDASGGGALLSRYSLSDRNVGTDREATADTLIRLTDRFSSNIDGPGFVALRSLAGALREGRGAASWESQGV